MYVIAWLMHKFELILVQDECWIQDALETVTKSVDLLSDVVIISCPLMSDSAGDFICSWEQPIHDQKYICASTLQHHVDFHLVQSAVVLNDPDSFRKILGESPTLKFSTQSPGQGAVVTAHS